MPIPKPTTDESQEDFLARCAGDDIMNDEYPDKDQRVAVCYQSWRDAQKGIDKHEVKSISIELKEDEPGAFTARIAKLNVIDKDNDMTVPGAFPKNKTVLVSAYGHASWSGELPVGKAIIKEVGDEVIAEGQFNLASNVGKEHYETVKFSGKLQEWSYGFMPLKFDFKDIEEHLNVRILKKVEPFEISPVLKGSGMETATLSIKSNTGQTYSQQAATVLDAVNGLMERSKSLAELRRKEGRAMSKANIESLNDILVKMENIRKELTGILANSEPADKGRVQKLYLQYMEIREKLYA
ncbi:MAG: HK97 family phage prohead protease [Dehalococcoidia bacterium]|nr:HK97 family phage prohead protease [Dehalococcoidia bacterium]